jgi:uncharacterized ferredoxin-like protein
MKKIDFNQTIIRMAEEIAVAAETAPKAKGWNLIETIIVSGKDILKLAEKMVEIGGREDHGTFIRDGENIKSSQAVIIIGTSLKRLGLKYCGLCGAKNCNESEIKGLICAFNSGDLGIAIGSAASKAMDLRIDNRVMYTVGMAAMELKLFGPEVKIAYGLPLSISGKNPFFDRK